MHIRWNATTIGLCAIVLLYANLTYAGQKQFGTVGGTIKCTGVLQSSDKVNKNAEIIGGWFRGDPMIDMGSLYQDVYTFTATASGTATIENFWTDHPKGQGTLNRQFYSNTHDVQNDYIVDVGSTTFKVVEGCEYSFVISSAVCDDQQYSFSLVLPGTTPNGGGDGGNGDDTIITPNYVTVKFYANGGTLYEEDHFGPSGYTVTTISSPCTKSILKGKTLLPYAPSCKKNGYKFAGWFTEGGDKIQDSYTVKSALSVYAHWNREITVRFNANKGNGSLGPQTIYAGQDAFLLRNNGRIRREGYDFVGWAESPTGSVKYEDGGKINVSSSSSDKVLYAVWDLRSITVYFNDNWDDGGVSVQQYTPGTKYGRFPSSPTRNGYVFEGWFNKSGMLITTTSVVPDQDTELYARWTPRMTDITVRFRLNDGTTSIIDTKSYSVGTGTTTYYGQMPTPTREGWYFVGWYTQSSGGKRIKEYSQVESTVYDLYACWRQVPEVENLQLIPVNTGEYGEPDWPIVQEVPVPAMVYGEFSTHDDVGWFGQNSVMLISGFSESGWVKIRFGSESTGAKVLSLGLWGDDNNWNSPLGSAIESGSFDVFLQKGNSYAFYITLVDRNSGEEICDGESALLNYDIQIGDNESETSGLNIPPAPEVSVEGNAIRLIWASMPEATEYHIYRRSHDEIEPNVYSWIYRLVAVVDGSSTTYVDNEIDNDCSVIYSLKAVIDGETSIRGPESSNISLAPSFAATADVEHFSYLPSTGTISIDSNLKWECYAESDGDWLHVETIGGTVQGSRLVSFSVDENTTQEERTGYVWFRKSSGMGWPRGSSSVVIVQKARGNDVQMTFMEKAGSSSRTYTESEAYDDFPVPERAGYTFLGWATDENGGELVTCEMLASADITELYPQWRPNTYTIRFNANGGSGTMPNQTVTYDTGWQFAKCKFSKAGSAFLGWATAPDGTVLYGDETDGENLSVVDGAVVDLYAVWGDAARYYGPWGYNPEPVKDDAAVSTLANISMSINGAEMAEGDVVAAYDSRGRLRAIGKVASVNGRLGASLSMKATAGTELMFLLWKYGGQTSDICVADTWIVAPAPGTVDHGELRLAGTLETKIPFRHCQISLTSAGWHLVSFSALPNDPSPAAAFADVADKIDQVVQGSKVWKPKTGGRLTKLEVGIGYWVRTKEDNVAWTLGGLSNPGVEIALSKGWNLVGYPLPASGSPAIVLKTAYGAGKFTQIVDGSKVYPGRLEALEPGKGYWFYAPAACTITFDQN